MKKNVAVILAGGVGSRLGLSTPKQFFKVAGKMVVEHTIACYTYGNKNYRNMSVNELRTDLQNFTNQAIPVLGDVDTIIFAQGVDLESYSDNKFDVLYSAGYRYFMWKLNWRSW